MIVLISELLQKKIVQSLCMASSTAVIYPLQTGILITESSPQKAEMQDSIWDEQAHQLSWVVDTQVLHRPE